MTPPKRQPNPTDTTSASDWLDPDERARTRERLDAATNSPARKQQPPADTAGNDPTEHYSSARILGMYVARHLSRTESATDQEHFYSLALNRQYDQAFKWLEKHSPHLIQFLSIAYSDYELRRIRKSLLRWGASRAIDKRRMIYRAEQVEPFIEEAREGLDASRKLTDTEALLQQATVEASQPHFTVHRPPDTLGTAETIELQAHRLTELLAQLRERQLPVTATEADVAITALHEIAAKSERTARQLGLHAVSQELISQNRLAKLLGVTQATVSRWFHRGLDTDQQPKGRRSRADSSD